MDKLKKFHPVPIQALTSLDVIIAGKIYKAIGAVNDCFVIALPTGVLVHAPIEIFWANLN